MWGKQITKVSLVVPVFNEDENIVPFLKQVGTVFEKNESELEIVFVDDGSSDRSLDALLEAQRECRNVRVVELSRNFGKEAALSAGLKHTSGDVVVPLDIDLQQPPEVIPEMLGKWEEGYEVVLGRCIDRSRDSFAKHFTSKLFFKSFNWMADIRLPEDVGDFRLMDRCVVDAINTLPENHRFMKGLFAWVGFKIVTVNFERPSRLRGKTKFTAAKLLKLAIDGITSFSIMPLRVWTFLGLFVTAVSFAYALAVVFRVFLFGVDVPGYASLLVALLFLGGVQLLGIGILGEYLGRTYIETKNRPPYIVRKVHEQTSKV